MGSTPLTLRCPKCKKGREWDMDRANYDGLSHLGLMPTGRVKLRRMRRANVLVELRHEGLSWRTQQPCGHVFWSKHPEALRLLRHFHPEKCSPEYYSRHHVGGT